MKHEFEKKVAVVVTEYRYRAHADVIVGRLLGEYDDFTPRIGVASIYTDQVPTNDMSRGAAKRYGVPICSTIKEAIAIGGKEDPIDGVVIVGEHGEYPTNEMGQHMYPRRRLLEDVLQAMDELDLQVPIFNDKHLSYNIENSLWMYHQLKERQLPFLGGSSIPHVETKPAFVKEEAKTLTEVLVVSWSASTEAYGFHGLEVMQGIAENRDGGETGVAAIQSLENEEVWEAMDRGEWPEDLMMAALSTFEGLPEGHPRKHVPNPELFIIEYRDGTKGYVISLQNLVNMWLSAYRCENGDIKSSQWVTKGGRSTYHFATLASYIEDMVFTGKPAVPLERTMLTSGMTNLAMEALYRKQKLNTPELHMTYHPNGS